MTLYPPGHPSVSRPLTELASLVTLFLTNQSSLRFGIINQTLFCEGVLFVNPGAVESEMAGLLAERGIEGVLFSPGITALEIGTFLALLGKRAIDTSTMEKELATRQIKSIALTRVQEKVQEIKEERSEVGLTYGNAMDAVRTAFQDIEKGRIPSSRNVIAVVDRMADLTIHDPSTLLGLTLIKDYDNYTFNHSVNVGILAMALGTATGMERETLREIGIAGLLHDIGKITIRKSVLNKPGKLSSIEYEEIKKHAENGAKIVGKMKGINPSVAEAVLGHHIMHNRQGYPDWAREHRFTILPEILAVADCYDAITTLRVYQPPIPPKSAIDQLRKLSGTYLDGSLVEAFATLMGKYPVGTLVRLDTNELAVVTRVEKQNEYLTLKVIVAANGTMLEEPRLATLGNEPNTPNIISAVDPMVKEIDVARYLS
jgi:putative nucleotidyltransferase with HDIG domain